MNRKIKTEIAIGTILLFVIIIGVFIWIYSQMNMGISGFRQRIPINQVIEQSGFSEEEAQVIIKAAIEQVNINQADIIKIRKVEVNKLEIETCIQQCDHGGIYNAKKMNGSWVFKNDGTSIMWTI